MKLLDESFETFRCLTKFMFPHKWNDRRLLFIHMVIHFNRTYSPNVKTNIGNLFIKLLMKHFPKNSEYHNIFNLNNLKLSYCCTTENVIADQSQTAHSMLSVSCNVYYTKLHLQHLGIVLFITYDGRLLLINMVYTSSNNFRLRILGNKQISGMS